MAVLNNILYFLITIGILVFVHELGHFLAAKVCHMRVDRFSLGFPPRAFGKKIGDTDYCVSWIPIGGYVKIAGMIDESLDTEFLNRPPEPWEFRSKPTYQKLFVMVSGVLMNLLLALVIFSGLSFVNGRIMSEVTEIGTVVKDSPADKAGLQAGDKILYINGVEMHFWEDIQNAIFVDRIGEDLSFKVLRNGRTLEIGVPRKDVPDVLDESFGISPSHLISYIDAVEPDLPAARLGLQPNDVITAVGHISNPSPRQITDFIHSHPEKEITIEWKRGEQTMSGQVTPNADGRIGIRIGSLYTGPVKRVSYSVFQAFAAGTNDVVGAGVMVVRSIGWIITGKVPFSKAVGGPIMIAKFATQSAAIGAGTFLWFIASLSIMLAMVNIMPFPALDGGHLVFLLYEKIFKREIPSRVKIIFQQVGFALLMLLMVFIIYNDIVRF